MSDEKQRKPRAKKESAGEVSTVPQVIVEFLEKEANFLTNDDFNELKRRAKAYVR